MQYIQALYCKRTFKPKGGDGDGASLLLQMPHQKGDKESPEGNPEKRQASYRRSLPRLWHEDISHRPELISTWQ